MIILLIIGPSILLFNKLYLRKSKEEIRDNVFHCVYLSYRNNGIPRDDDSKKILLELIKKKYLNGIENKKFNKFQILYLKFYYRKALKTNTINTFIKFSEK